MKTIDEIQHELRKLADELELIKEERSLDEDEIDWNQISVDACAKAIKPHPLDGVDEYFQKCYMTTLLTVAWLDEKSLAESLFLAHRIAFGMDYLEKHENLYYEYIAAKSLSYTQLDELLELFADKDEKLMLILECLLIAGTFEKGRKAAFEYIAKMSELLGLTKENIVFLSNLAAVVLTRDTSKYKCDIWNEWELFNCYLAELDLKNQIVFAEVVPDKEEEYSLAPSFKKCKSVTLDKNKGVVKFVCIYSKQGNIRASIREYQHTYTQIVSHPFILLASANEIFPRSPVGVSVDLLTPVSFAKEKYAKALNKFKKENKNED